MCPHTWRYTKSSCDSGQYRYDDVDDFSPDVFVFHGFKSYEFLRVMSYEFDVGTLRAASRIRPLKNIHEEFPRESFHKVVSTQHAASLQGTGRV